MNSVPFSALLPPLLRTRLSWELVCGVLICRGHSQHLVLFAHVKEVGEKETGTLAISPAIHPTSMSVLQVCPICSWKLIHRLLFISSEVAVGSRILPRNLSWHNAKATVGLKRAWARQLSPSRKHNIRGRRQRPALGRTRCKWKGSCGRALG